MKRLIFSLYIDIPSRDLDIFDKDVLKDKQIPTNHNTKKELHNNFKQLVECKIKYAKSINADFILNCQPQRRAYERSQLQKQILYKPNGDREIDTILEYDEYLEKFRNKYPEITTYNVVNFYKLHLLYDLSKYYDEILYLDFDVVPNTKENFFDVWDLSKGLCVLNNNDNVLPIGRVTETTQTVRSPTAKYYNAQAMLFEKGLSIENDVINTGIIGINKQHIEQLKYFENFDNDIEMMKQVKHKSIFPSKIVKSFGFDNETLFGVKIKEHNVPVQWLDNDWHYFFDKWLFIPKTAKLIHAINKRFDIVWKNYNA